MSLVINQKLAQKQTQKQILQAKQSICQDHELRQYQKQEDFIIGLIEYVNKNNKLISFNKD